MRHSEHTSAPRRGGGGPRHMCWGDLLKVCCVYCTMPSQGKRKKKTSTVPSSRRGACAPAPPSHMPTYDSETMATRCSRSRAGGVRMRLNAGAMLVARPWCAWPGCVAMPKTWQLNVDHHTRRAELPRLHSLHVTASHGCRIDADVAMM